MFDLILSSLYIDAGRPVQDMPGLYAAAAPRKAARLRAQDQLVLYMKMTGSAVLTHAQQQEMLAKLAETYFTSSGSITTGLRAVVTRLNDFLLNRNLRNAREGQAVAVLGLAAIHGSTLLLAHSGAVHTFLIGKTQVQHFDDGQGGRGLGLSKQVVPRYYQSALEAGDVLLISAEPPPIWTTKSLAGGTQVSVEHLRRRLLSQSGVELHAGALKLQAGKGQISWQRAASGEQAVTPQRTPPAAQAAVADKAPGGEPALPAAKPERPAAVPVAQSAPVQAETRAAEPGRVEIAESTSPVVDKPAAVETPAAPPVVEAKPSTEPQGMQTASAQKIKIPAPQRQTAAQVQAAPATTVQPTPAQPVPAKETPLPKKAARKVPSGPNPALVATGKAISSTIKAGGAARAKAGRGLLALLARLFPQRSEPLVNLSPSAMLAIAILVPVAVVVASLTVYTQVGNKEKMAVNIYTAQQYAQQAQQATDAKTRRDAWTQVRLWARQAGENGPSEQADALLLEAEQALDQLDGIERLDFQSVIPGGMGPDVNITRMAATITDVYMLDESQGRIYRLGRDGVGYSLDSNFICGPGKAGGQVVGKLIDLAPLPVNNQYRATILGIDGAGTVVYCAPNQSGYDSLTLPPPDAGWGQIIAMTTYGDRLFLLDPKMNAVWYYNGDSGIYTENPRLFFSNQIPKMDDVIDLAVDQEFLYLLHSSGQMTVCEKSDFEFSPTRCSDPMPFGDPREGREQTPLQMDGTHFVQIQTTQPPDPSLYMLDQAYKSIYHFSLRRLNFQRQYQQESSAYYPMPEEPPTAFAITTNRRALMAFKNQVFYAVIP